MTIPVKVRPAAQRDIDEAARWYESQQPGLGDAFLDEFLATTSRISETPFAYPEVGRSTRRVLLQRFPFGIYYRLADDLAAVIPEAFQTLRIAILVEIIETDHTVLMVPSCTNPLKNELHSRV